MDFIIKAISVFLRVHALEVWYGTELIAHAPLDKLETPSLETAPIAMC